MKRLLAALLPVCLLAADQCTECRSAYEAECSFQACADACRHDENACTSCTTGCLTHHCSDSCTKAIPQADQEESCSSCLNHAREGCNFHKCLTKCKNPESDGCVMCVDDCAKDQCFHKCGSTSPTARQSVKVGSNQICGGYQGSGWTEFNYNKANNYTSGGSKRGIVMRISTASCKFTEVPNYAASMKVPLDVLPPTTGALTISTFGITNPKKAFNIHVWHPMYSGEELIKLSTIHRWVASWIGVTGPHRGMTGAKAPWKNIHKGQFSLRVGTKTSKCPPKPSYIVSFYGAARVQGANRVFQADIYSFKLYVESQDTPTNKAFTRGNFVVGWLCLPTAAVSSANWDNSIRDPATTKLSINQKKMHWPITPIYVFSIHMGDDDRPKINPWGINTMTMASINGFDAYLGDYRPTGEKITAAVAWGGGYKVNYFSFLGYFKPRKCKLSKWYSWSACTTTCDGGTKTRYRSILLRPWPYNVNASYKGCPPLTQTKACATTPCFVAKKRVDANMIVAGVPTANYVEVCRKVIMHGLAKRLGIKSQHLNMTEVQSSEHDQIQKETMAVEFSTTFKITAYARNGEEAERLRKAMGSKDIADMLRQDLHIKDLLKMADDDSPQEHIYFKFVGRPVVSDSASFERLLLKREHAAAAKKAKAAAAAAKKAKVQAKAQAAKDAVKAKAAARTAAKKKKAELKQQEEVLASMIANDEAKETKSTERRFLVSGFFGAAVTIGGVVAYLYVQRVGGAKTVAVDDVDSAEKGGHGEKGEDDSLIKNSRTGSYTD